MCKGLSKRGRTRENRARTGINVDGHGEKYVRSRVNVHGHWGAVRKHRVNVDGHEGTVHGHGRNVHGHGVTTHSDRAPLYRDSGGPAGPGGLQAHGAALHGHAGTRDSRAWAQRNRASSLPLGCALWGSGCCLVGCSVAKTAPHTAYPIIRYSRGWTLVRVHGHGVTVHGHGWMSIDTP